MIVNVMMDIGFKDARTGKWRPVSSKTFTQWKSNSESKWRIDGKEVHKMGLQGISNLSLMSMR